MKLKRIHPSYSLAGLLLLAGWLWAPLAMAQTQVNPCTAPKIKANTACGGVVTLVANGSAVNGTTYNWTLGNGSTATGFGPINVVYTGAGPYTVTLTVSNPACDALFSKSTTRVTPDLGGGCCPSGIAAANLLGGVGVTTTLNGGTTYSGTYRVLGNLVLTGGNYTLASGTTFFVDGYATKTPVTGGFQRTVSGSTITVGDMATLTLDNSQMTSSGSSADCPMWGGLVVGESGRGPSNVTYRLVVANNSVISHALCGIRFTTDAGGTGTAYRLANSAFVNNLTHVYDTSGHLPGQYSYISSCDFSSDANKMHFPYNYTSATDQFVTYQALFLAPSPKGMDALTVQNCTFDQQVYGIVNNLDSYYYGGVRIENNYLDHVYGTGIWTMNNNFSASPTGVPTVVGNRVGLFPGPGQTPQIPPAGTLYGLVDDAYGYRNVIQNNLIFGFGNDLTAPKQSVGLSITGQTDAIGNQLLAHAQVVVTTDLDDSDIFDNLFAQGGDDFVVQPGRFGTYSVRRLGCNTFQSTPPGSTSRGIVVQTGASINDIGSSSSPAANQFDGIGTHLYNDGTVPFTYFKTNSSQEMPFPSTGGGQYVVVNNIPLPASTLNGYCANQGANYGVNQARGTAPSADYLAAIMDSVRRQLVPPARGQGYLHEIIRTYRDASQPAALEAWWRTLAGANGAAYSTVGRALLQQYDQQPATLTDAGRVLASLQPVALLDAELAAHLQLRAVLRHLPQTMPRLTAADSTTLRTVAWSGTGSAIPAGRWLRYFHPRLLLPVAATTPAARAATAPARSLVSSGATLGAAYPNPAQTEVRISCRLARAGQAAELRFTNLLTGQLARVVPVEGTGTERSQQVALAGLPAGQYAYQLVVDGQLAAAPQKLVINP